MDMEKSVPVVARTNRLRLPDPYRMRRISCR